MYRQLWQRDHRKPKSAGVTKEESPHDQLYRKYPQAFVEALKGAPLSLDKTGMFKMLLETAGYKFIVTLREESTCHRQSFR